MLIKRSLIVSFIVTAYCCILLIVVTFKGDPSREIIASREISQQSKSIFVKYRRCLFDSMQTFTSEEVWFKSMALVNSCMDKYDMEKRLPLMRLENNDETKYVLNTFPKLETGEECNVVTLGIGKDIGAEMQLSKHLSPLCHFHGADPSAKDNEQIYTKIGSFYPFAVAATNGIRTASLFESSDCVIIDVATNSREIMRRTKKADADEYRERWKGHVLVNPKLMIWHVLNDINVILMYMTFS